MPGVISWNPPDLHTNIIDLTDHLASIGRAIACQVTCLACDNDDCVTDTLKVPRKLMVACPAGLIERRESLMDQEDAHFKPSILPNPIE